MNVNTYIEHVVVPIRVMIAAPLALSVELVDVVTDPLAIIAVACGVVVDLFFLVPQTLMTIVPVVMIVIGGARHATHRKRKR